MRLDPPPRHWSFVSDRLRRSDPHRAYGTAMSADDIWVWREGDKLILRVENDGWTFLNRGPEADDREIIGISGYHQVIVVGGHKWSLRYADDWETVLAHFTKEK
jgi:hypothetical protein